MLRVKNGPCAPLRLSSMLSSPATGMTTHLGDGGRAARRAACNVWSHGSVTRSQPRAIPA